LADIADDSITRRALRSTSAEANQSSWEKTYSSG
jgi:hypothetical protein